jgi:hypothetical protein
MAATMHRDLVLPQRWHKSTLTGYIDCADLRHAAGESVRLCARWPSAWRARTVGREGEEDRLFV